MPLQHTPNVMRLLNRQLFKVKPGRAHTSCRGISFWREWLNSRSSTTGPGACVVEMRQREGQRTCIQLMDVAALPGPSTLAVSLLSASSPSDSRVELLTSAAAQNSTACFRCLPRLSSLNNAQPALQMITTARQSRSGESRDCLSVC